MAENAKILASNKTAARNYFFLEKFEAGIELFGTEVKSIRQGKVNLKDCYAAVDSGELFVYGMHISPYEKGNIFNKDPLRPKKLLLHKSEIMKLLGAVQRDGCSIIPISMYLKHGRVKVEIALARGKKEFDKRQSLREEQDKREALRAMRYANKQVR